MRLRVLLAHTREDYLPVTRFPESRVRQLSFRCRGRLRVRCLLRAERLPVAAVGLLGAGALCSSFALPDDFVATLIRGALSLCGGGRVGSEFSPSTTLPIRTNGTPETGEQGQ